MSRERSIPIDPKYGLNPTMPDCFYCGESKNEIAFLGANYNGQAPSRMVIDIEPCDKCKEKYEGYTLLVEATQDLTARRKKFREPKPTGRWCAVRKECLNVPEPSPIAFVEPAEMDKFFAMFDKLEKAEVGA